jgi:hypothetical protein
MANLPKNAHAASPAWVMSHVVFLPAQTGQGTYVLDTARVKSSELATEVAARQLQAVVALLASSHGEPDASWEGVDAKGAKIEVRRWSHLHLRTARFVEVSLIQIIRHGASDKARDRQQSVGSCGMAINPLLWPRSARRIACATRMSMAIASTSRNCSGTSHG